MVESDNESGGVQTGCREQDGFLPMANVSRIMKKALPTNAKISKDAKETLQECVSEFISFITSEASYKCQKEKRKTINGDDLLWAMTTVGFEDYVEPLKIYLRKYREMEGEKNAMIGRGFQRGQENVGEGVGCVYGYDFSSSMMMMEYSNMYGSGSGSQSSGRSTR